MFHRFANRLIAEELAGCCEQIEWLIRTRLPVAKLRFVKAFERLVKRKSVESTKNFKGAAAAFIRFLFISRLDAQLIQSRIRVLLV